MKCFLKSRVKMGEIALIFLVIFTLHNECFISLKYLVTLEFSRFYCYFVCLRVYTTCINTNARVPLTARRLTINFERNSQIVTFSETYVSATFTFTYTLAIYDTLVTQPPDPKKRMFNRQNESIFQLTVLSLLTLYCVIHNGKCIYMNIDNNSGLCLMKLFKRCIL